MTEQTIPEQDELNSDVGVEKQGLSEEEVRGEIRYFQDQAKQWREILEKFQADPILIHASDAEDKVKKQVQQRNEFVDLFMKTRNRFDQMLKEMRGSQYSGDIFEKIDYLTLFFHDLGNSIQNFVGFISLYKDYGDQAFLYQIQEGVEGALATLNAFRIETFGIPLHSEPLISLVNKLRKIINRQTATEASKNFIIFSVDDPDNFLENNNLWTNINFPVMSRVFFNILQNLSKAYRVKATQEELSDEELAERYPTKLWVEFAVRADKLIISFTDAAVGFPNAQKMNGVNELGSEIIYSELDGAELLEFVPAKGVSNWSEVASGQGIGLSELHQALNHDFPGTEMICGTIFDDNGKPVGARIEIHSQIFQSQNS